MPSFDLVSDIDMGELKNAIDQAKERFLHVTILKEVMHLLNMKKITCD